MREWKYENAYFGFSLREKEGMETVSYEYSFYCGGIRTG